MGVCMTKNEIPVLFQSKDECCGCAACLLLCPQKAIKMVMDDEGFLYPEIIAEICIRCGKCVNICLFKQ